MTAPYKDRLNVARAMVDARDELRDRAPVWLMDQVDAAGREQHRLLLEVSAHLPIVDPARRWHQSSAPDMETFGLDRASRLYAASMDCRPCIHLRRHGPQPAWVDLNHRLVTCQRCAATWRTPLDDERCEVCDEPAGPRYTPFLIQLGYLAIGGNAGECCAWLVTGEAAA